MPINLLDENEIFETNNQNDFKKNKQISELNINIDKQILNNLRERIKDNNNIVRLNYKSNENDFNDVNEPRHMDKLIDLSPEENNFHIHNINLKTANSDILNIKSINNTVSLRSQEESNSLRNFIYTDTESNTNIPTEITNVFDKNYLKNQTPNNQSFENINCTSTNPNIKKGESSKNTQLVNNNKEILINKKIGIPHLKIKNESIAKNDLIEANKKLIKNDLLKNIQAKSESEDKLLNKDLKKNQILPCELSKLNNSSTPIKINILDYDYNDAKNQKNYSAENSNKETDGDNNKIKCFEDINADIIVETNKNVCNLISYQNPSENSVSVKSDSDPFSKNQKSKDNIEIMSGNATNKHKHKHKQNHNYVNISNESNKATGENFIMQNKIIQGDNNANNYKHSGYITDFNSANIVDDNDKNSDFENLLLKKYQNTSLKDLSISIIKTSKNSINNSSDISKNILNDLENIFQKSGSNKHISISALNKQFDYINSNCNINNNSCTNKNPSENKSLDNIINSCQGESKDDDIRNQFKKNDDVKLIGSDGINKKNYNKENAERYYNLENFKALKKEEFELLKGNSSEQYDNNKAKRKYKKKNSNDNNCCVYYLKINDDKYEIKLEIDSHDEEYTKLPKKKDGTLDMRYKLNKEYLRKITLSHFNKN